MQIRRIDAAETRPLRWTVLRPEMAGPDAVVLDGDDDPAGAHFGAFVADELVGVGSVFPQPHPDRPAPGDWRLRGMAVADGRRSLGVGKAVLEACLAFAAAGGASR
ncbi:MAG: GNAT family N-acetyltransferase, partial [Acidimicrobiia bacterium]|nr:GNAT family N-acetyltransferase [Acidimicrobiia bacterium]